MALTNGPNHIMMRIARARLTVDKSGRVVLPKALREQMHLAPGDMLEMETNGESIILRPLRRRATVKKERGIWVYQGEATGASIPDLIDREREKHLQELARRTS